MYSSGQLCDLLFAKISLDLWRSDNLPKMGELLKKRNVENLCCEPQEQTRRILKVMQTGGEKRQRNTTSDNSKKYPENSENIRPNSVHANSGRD